jgi:FG-GAP-like repeat
MAPSGKTSNASSSEPSVAAGCLWSVAKFVIGLVLYTLATVLVFIVADELYSRPVAVVAVILAILVAPIVLAKLLTPSFRRLDPLATYLNVLPGAAAVCALVALIALPLGAPGPVSRALNALGTRYPGVPPQAGSVARALGVALDPNLADAGARARDAGVRDAAHDETPAVDASVSADAVAFTSATPDADDASVTDADDASDGSDAEDASDADDASGNDAEAVGDADDVSDVPAVDDASGGVDASAAAPVDPMLIAEVPSPCSRITAVLVGDLEGDTRDEIVVQCATSLHVLALTEGTLVERMRFEALAPTGLTSELGRPAIFDMDGDGRRDVVVCEHYTSERGGGRGGAARYVTNRGDGRFGDLVQLDRLDGCGAVAVGDITGDGREELLVAHSGNPYLATLPQGDLAWFSRTGRQWTRRGRLPVGRWPVRVTVRDVSGDHIGDAIVEHGWENSPLVVLPGSRTGLRPIDVTLRPSETPATLDAEGRFDHDDIPDAVRVTSDSVLRISRSQRSDAPTIRAVTGTPWILPPRADAGAPADGRRPPPT